MEKRIGGRNSMLTISGGTRCIAFVEFVESG